jgi:hypothetical protein
MPMNMPRSMTTRDNSYRAEEQTPGKWTVTYVRVATQPLGEIQVDKDKDGIWWVPARPAILLQPMQGIVALMARIAKLNE